jgi:hypothetical protein
MLSEMLVEFIDPRERFGYSAAAINRTKYADLPDMDCAVMAVQLILARECQIAMWALKSWS